MASNESYINVDTVQSIQKLVMDRNETLRDGKYVSYHLNGMFQTVKNTELFATNEPSNVECIKLPFKYTFGTFPIIGENRHVIFTGDNENNSEIGIINLDNCSYEKIANNPCLNFRKSYGIITGSVRLNNKGEEEIVFADGGNPDRIINLDKIPYKYIIDELTSCKIKEYSNILDCENIKLDPPISIPCLSVETSGSGSLPDGVYSIHIAYSFIKENYEKATDYMVSSLNMMINNNMGSSALNVNISNLDRDFPYYRVLLTGTVKGITTHKIVGTYPTSQNQVLISDWINEEYQDGIPSTELTVKKVIYENSQLITSNSETLFRIGVKKQDQLNYQKQAFNIKGKYIVKQVPYKYYKEGQDIGYFRNEIYRFKIRWYKKNGSFSEDFHIKSVLKNKDLSIVSGKDIFEKEKKKFFEVYNTAGNMIPQASGDIIGYGDLGGWMSTDNYPEDNEVFGEFACTPICDFMMPDEEKVHRYQIIDGELYINILGVQFYDIEHPKDSEGKYIEDITHYEIVRSERDESNSRVVSRGIVTNMGEYKNKQGTPILYSNFPQNDVRANTYISKDQTYRRHGKEYNFQPLDKFHSNKFSFYSPYGSYFGRQSLAGTYLNVETEESGEVRGYFEEPYKHPKYKLLTNFTFYVSAALGIAEALTVQMGKDKVTRKRKEATKTLKTGGLDSGTEVESPLPSEAGIEVSVESEESAFKFPNWKSYINDIKTGTANPLKIAARGLLITLQTLMVPFTLLLIAAQFASNLINIIRDFSAYEQYARQYNSEVLYNKQKKIVKGNKRRKFSEQPFWLDNGIYNSFDYQINNGGRNSSIYLSIENDLPFTSVDNSRRTMSEFGLKSKDSNQIVISNSSVYYVSIMKNNPNQYGTIEGFKAVKIHSCPISITKKENDINDLIYTSPILFGGDCIIAEQTHVNKCPLFKQNLTNTNYPDGTPYDYRLYNNIGYSRYWADFTDYDIGNIINIFGKSSPTLQKLPNQKFNLDLPNSKKNEWVERDQVFYLSVNGVFRYIAEVPYNIWFRENKEEDVQEVYQPHYSEKLKDLSLIFRSDLQVKPEGFNLNPSYKYLSQIYTSSIPSIKIEKNEREENTVLYSLPSGSDIGSAITNNWRFFLQNNKFTFDRRDFGKLTGVHSLDQDKLIFLFSKASPYLSLGRSVLELKNQNVVIGDGGIFSQAPRELMHTDVAYGSNHDRYAFRSTQFGPFYVSEYQGKFFNFSKDLDEITREDFHKWGAEFIPLHLKKQFPDWEGIHNPIFGVGYQIIFDNIYETVYFCKKDYIANSEVYFNKDEQNFYSNGVKVDVGDPLYFKDVSFTLSYNPAMKGFVSFHNWIPDFVIQEERHFSTIKNQIIWKHNISKNSFCNFYGKQYTYQLGITQSTGQNVQWLQSLEIISEFYKYKNNELDRYHLLKEFFDWAMIWNSEQFSGLLKLTDGSSSRYKLTEFPKISGTHHMEIPYEKVENKYRFNMFYDYIKERLSDKQPIVSKENGFEFIANQPSIDFNIKRPKRFRHYWNSIWLSKENPKDIQIITKFVNSKLTYSPR